jgi:phage gp46-like protein
MADLQTRLIQIGHDSLPQMDLALDGFLLAEDDGLLTAVIISLFTDRQANADDQLPFGNDRRGWWGDDLAPIAGDKIGSRLWLNEAAKQLGYVLTKDREYAEEALRWLLDDGVASAVDVVASSPRAGVRALEIAISRPNKPVARYQFQRFWKVD